MVHCSKANVVTQRLHSAAIPYLVSVCIDMDARHDWDANRRYPSPVASARAVCDDFGNLVLVTGWH